MVALAGVSADDKPMVAVATNEAARKSGIKAGDLVRGASKILGGGGGGKPDFAQGGGSDASKIDAALQSLTHEAMKGMSRIIWCGSVLTWATPGSDWHCPTRA